MDDFGRALTEARPCFDPSCVDPETGRPSVGEPEQDGSHRYYTCPVCGNDYGWEQVSESPAQPSGDSCAAGIPESVRRNAMGTPPPPDGKVSLGTSIRVRS